jgi:hypothetical protein
MSRGGFSSARVEEMFAVWLVLIMMGGRVGGVADRLARIINSAEPIKANSNSFGCTPEARELTSDKAGHE